MRAREQVVDDMTDLRRASVEAERIFDGVSEGKRVQRTLLGLLGQVWNVIQIPEFHVIEFAGAITAFQTCTPTPKARPVLIASRCPLEIEGELRPLHDDDYLNFICSPGEKIPVAVGFKRPA